MAWAIKRNPVNNLLKPRNEFPGYPPRDNTFIEGFYKLHIFFHLLKKVPVYELQKP